MLNHIQPFEDTKQGHSTLTERKAATWWHMSTTTNPEESTYVCTQCGENAILNASTAIVMVQLLQTGLAIIITDIYNIEMHMEA